MNKMLFLISCVFVLLLFSCSKSGSGSTSTTAGTGLAAPSITAFSPSVAPVDSIVTITGSNFSTVVSDDIVRFNDTIAVVQLATASQLTVVVPVGASTGKITVTVGSQTVTSAQNFVVSDQWTFLTNFPGASAGPCISFSLGDNLYVGMGQAAGGAWQQEL